MRVLLVGRPDERERLRAEIDRTAFTIAGEFDTLAEARNAEEEVDAILVGVGRTLRVRQASPKGSPHNCKQQKGIDDVNGDVDETIAARIESTERVVDGERQADQRPPGQRRSLFGRGERRRDVADLFVDDDRMIVIEDERRGERVRIERERDDGEASCCRRADRGLDRSARWWLPGSPAH
jgi:hypothetical protein